ncbi:MAG: GNAT family N-acetyltransferase [Deltaproteobacteria bacterium]
MQVAIVPARSEHFEEVLVLLQQLWPGRLLDGEAIHNVYMGNLTSEVQAYYVALKGDRVVGFITLHIITNLWAQGCLMQIEELVVSESCRGQGIGRELINQALLVGNERGCRSVEVTSAFHRTQAHRFYEMNGFVKKAYHFIWEQS